MTITIDLDVLLSRAYLCGLDTEVVKYTKVIGGSGCNLSDFQLLLDSQECDLLYVESREEDGRNLVKDGVYEGGFTVWESNWHFLKFLRENLPQGGGRVLDLGCGCGFVGIFSFIRGYDVCFQDMNKEVLERSLLYNFILNYWFVSFKKSYKKGIVSDRNSLDNNSRDTIRVEIAIGSSINFSDITSTLSDLMVKSKWVGSDEGLHNSMGLTFSTWEKLVTNPTDVEFDYILSSETLYRKEEYENISRILEIYLSVSGVGYFATKRYYFGIGGGSLEFIDYIQKHHKNTLIAEILTSISTKTSSNPIDIIKVLRKL